MENEVISWRSVAKEISKAECNLRSVTGLLREKEVLPDGYEIVMRYGYQQSLTKANTLLNNMREDNDN